MNTNENLDKARKAKKDEFYTQYEDIEKEVSIYYEYNHDVFKDKVILCPCDNPERSNFTKYFVDNFDKFGIKNLYLLAISPLLRQLIIRCNALLNKLRKQFTENL